MPSAPLCDASATCPGAGTTGENDAFSCTAGSEFENAHAVGADHPHAVAAHHVEQRSSAIAAVVSAFGKPGGDDEHGPHPPAGAVFDHAITAAAGTAMIARSTPAGRSRGDRTAATSWMAAASGWTTTPSRQTPIV